ncbi:PAS domain S-box-containing protein [Desulforhopalus singaporensis]|uniref:HTH-type transcriptional regulatory protein TyrR n=2 Tax=Desulforhopalus singaporensis TaxID=91360 RepID=A0A1H0T7A8_9BACT|nr:PAS domain S-box-containing protein [Desulforhopalus singaporensis]
MQISDLLQPKNIWLEAETQLGIATSQLSMAQTEAAPVRSDATFLGLFVPSLHWRHIINPEYRHRPVKEYLLQDLPKVDINATNASEIDEISCCFIIVTNTTGDYVGHIIKDRPFLPLAPGPDTALTTAIIDSLPIGTIAMDLKETVVYANDAVLKTTGLTRRDLIGLPISDTLFRKKLSTIPAGADCEIVVINGKTLMATCSKIKIQGNSCGTVAVFQNISRADNLPSGLELEAMKNIAVEFSAIFENSYDGIYITDGEGNTLRVNQAYERITGLNRKNLLGKNMKEIVAKGLLNESITFKIRKSRVPLTISQKIHGGKEILVSGTPVFDEKGELSRVVSNVRDMTELNNFRRQLKKSQERASQYEYEVKNLRASQWVRTQLVYGSKKMEETIDLALQVARVDSTVLVNGESGTGKEIIANIIHRQSQRAETGSFIKINCGAIPGPLLESELFGYEEGAFTGAKKQGKPGMFELANNGTLFLDEIADLPQELQVKLLRVLQFKEIIRVGGVKTQKINIRLITATSKNLDELMAKGEFRTDLYYRLKVVPITVPPLRERPDDILPLTAFYLNRFNKQYNYSKGLSKDAQEVLVTHKWPGNVRELVNLVERLVVTTRGNVITTDDLPTSISRQKDQLTKIAPHTAGSLQEILDAVEKETLVRAFREHGSSRKVASALKISQTSAMRKARKHKLVFKKGWAE